MESSMVKVQDGSIREGITTKRDWTFGEILNDSILLTIYHGPFHGFAARADAGAMLHCLVSRRTAVDQRS